jgi:hypothetical protein
VSTAEKVKLYKQIVNAALAEVGHEPRVIHRADGIARASLGLPSRGDTVEEWAAAVVARNIMLGASGGARRWFAEWGIRVPAPSGAEEVAA